MKNRMILYITSFLQGLVFYAAIATLYRTSVGIRIDQLLLLDGLFMFFLLLFEIPWGVIADRIGYKNTMIISTVFYFLSKLIFLNAYTFMDFLFERVFLALASSGYSGVDSSILYLSCKDEEDPQKVFGTNAACGTAAMLVASFIFTFFIREHYRLAALLTCIAYAISAVLVCFIDDVKEERERQNFKDIFVLIKDTLKDTKTIMIVGSFAIIYEVGHEVSTFLNQIRYEAIGMNDALIGAVYILMIFLSLSEAFSAKLTHLFGRKKFSLLCFVVTGIATILIPFTDHMILTVLLFALISTFSILISPLYSTIQQELVKGTNRSTVISVFSMISGIITMGCDFTMSLAGNTSLNILFIFSGIIILISGIFFIKGITEIKKDRT